MPQLPSIKGSVFAGVAEKVNKLFESGELSREAAERWLQPDDFALLDSKISIASWYDIFSYTRLSELLRDVVGAGSNRYLEQMGRETARRLLEAGLYSQMEYLRNTRVAAATSSQERYEAFGRDLKRLTTMSNSIYNVSKWTPLPDPDNKFRYIIEVTEAEAMSDVIFWRAKGFMNEQASIHGSGNLWDWQRVSRGVVRFHMTLDL